MTDAPPLYLVVLYPGVNGHEALGAFAALSTSGARAELVSDEALVSTSEGARLVPHVMGYARMDGAHAVIIPGGDIKSALADATLVRALRARRGAWLLASGEAVRIAAAAGLVEGRRIARLPGEPPIAGAAQNAHARLVADGRLLTCFPGDSLVDLVLHLLSREQGDETARRTAHALGRDMNTFALGAHDER